MNNEELGVYYKEGYLYHSRRKSNAVKKDSVITGTNNHGYVRFKYKGKHHQAHRVIWEMFYGSIPKGKQIDHINGDRADNRIENLRLATIQENARNRKATTNITKTDSGKYRVSLKINGTSYYFGTHDELEFAELVVAEAREKYYGEYA